MVTKWVGPYKVIGTIKALSGGGCPHFEYNVGDEIELSTHYAGNLCGAFYHSIYPQIFMLEFGGKYPETWGNKGAVSFQCPDLKNPVTIVLRQEEHKE